MKKYANVVLDTNKGSLAAAEKIAKIVEKALEKRGIIPLTKKGIEQKELKKEKK